MPWNHRVVKEVREDGYEFLSIREVFYNKDGSIYAYTAEPIEIYGDTIEEIREKCQMILQCLEKEILVDGEVKFVDPFEKQKRKHEKKLV